jgi:hypothetical protein
MTDSDEKRKPLVSPYDDVIGQIEGERDTRLQAAPDNKEPASHRRRSRGAAPAEPQPSAERDDERPVLPRGGLVVMRRSGGLKFSSREVVVYRDGRVVHRQHSDGMSIYKGSTQRLAGEQLDEAMRLVDQAEFPPYAGFGRRQPPDALAYEIVARSRRRLKMAEVFQGRIPDSLAPLVAWLNRLLAEDGGPTEQ